ncbi:MAG: Eco57I restriction-modification methylase [bacterium ADurb.Bin157]|nr:MAG: Eco57I restriction-modification methylase [bacterium ADurb.Bin157]
MPTLQKLIDPTKGRDLAGHTASEELRPFVNQAAVLTRQYDNVVANPPYMGNKYLAPLLKTYLKQEFVGYEKDLFSSFIIRNLELANKQGSLGFMSPFVWMFISSYEELRNRLIDNTTIASLIQLEYSGFDGATVPICTFTLQKTHYPGFVGSYIRLSDFKGAENQAPKTLEAIQNKNCGWFFTTKPDDFKKIPGSPIAYWVSKRMREIFERGNPFGNIAEPRQGLATSDNKRFLRFWPEVSWSKVALGIETREEAKNSHKKWFPYNKGGEYRRWFGNNDFLINWENDGKELLGFAAELYGSPTRTIKNIPFYFKRCITWSFVSSSYFGVRYSDKGFIFDVGGSSAFCPEDQIFVYSGFLCSSLAFKFMQALNPTLNFQSGNVAVLPIMEQRVAEIKSKVDAIVQDAILLTREDWDCFETSWNFELLPLLNFSHITIGERFHAWMQACNARISKLKELEEANNKSFIDAYDLKNEMQPTVSEEQITLTVNPKYRYGSGLHDSEYQSRFRYDTTKELLSYAVGCIMGRYSLDKPGLIYANACNEGFDPTEYKTFPADDDGIVPVCDMDWFADDATPRLVEFIKTVFGAETLDENLAWIAESFEPKKGETPVETIRRYFSTQFFKNHMQMYKKRPIYWLFSSGKQKAFECLVYLHRYNESTLARMRAQYVTPLQGKLNARIDHLRRETDSAGSTAAKTKLRKEVEMLAKKQTELAKFDEELRHYADQRIKINLDDGVRVNYGKFGTLLAETKAITGGTDE